MPLGRCDSLPIAVGESPLGARLSVAEDVQAVAADLQLVAGRQRGPLDLVAVDEQAVQAAVVERAKLVLGGTHDEGMATGDGRIVEAQVRRGAAADPRPARGELDDDGLTVLLVGEVPARGIDLRADLVKPEGRRGGRGDGLGVERARLEQRGAAEAGLTARRAAGELVVRLERHRVPAAHADQRPRCELSGRAYLESFVYQQSTPSSSWQV